jgi:hypothetical protein
MEFPFSSTNEGVGVGVNNLLISKAKVILLKASMSLE